MARTDDISEKVADLLLDQSLKLGSHVVQDVVPTAVDGVIAGAHGVHTLGGKAVDAVKRGNAQKQLNEFEKSGAQINLTQFWALTKQLKIKTDTIKISSEDAEDFQKLLRREKMVFTVLDKGDDNYSMFVYMDKDIEKVQRAYDALLARRGQVSEMAADKFMDLMSPEKVRVIDRIDPVETELFRYFAREYGVLFTHLPGNEKRSDQIVYLPKDAEKVRQVMLSIGWALTSEAGPRIREQAQHYLQGRRAISAAIENPGSELYIVSAKNPSHAVRITASDYQLYKNGELVDSIDRSRPDFFTRCNAVCGSISDGVVLTKEEFESPRVTPESIREMPTMNLFPSDTIEVTNDGYVNNLYDGYDPIREEDRINSLAHLVAQKMTLDDEGNVNWGAFDPSVSLSEFAGYEHYQDAEEREGREIEFEHFKKAAFYGQDRIGHEEVDMTDRSLDFIVSRAYTRAGTRPQEPEQGAHERDSGERMR